MAGLPILSFDRNPEQAHVGRPDRRAVIAGRDFPTDARGASDEHRTHITTSLRVDCALHGVPNPVQDLPCLNCTPAAILAGIATAPALAAPALGNPAGDASFRDLWPQYLERLAAQQSVGAAGHKARARAYDAKEVS
jgi:hypothetical protein